MKQECIECGFINESDEKCVECESELLRNIPANHPLNRKQIYILHYDRESTYAVYRFINSETGNRRYLLRADSEFFLSPSRQTVTDAYFKLVDQFYARLRPVKGMKQEWHAAIMEFLKGYSDGELLRVTTVHGKGEKIKAKKPMHCTVEAYVWRMMRFTSGQDTRIPIAAEFDLWNAIEIAKSPIKLTATQLTPYCWYLDHRANVLVREMMANRLVG